MFVSPDEKSPERQTFSDVDEVKQKTAEALKGRQIDEFKHCFEPWGKKNVSIGVFYHMESTLKVTEV